VKVQAEDGVLAVVENEILLISDGKEVITFGNALLAQESNDNPGCAQP